MKTLNEDKVVTTRLVLMQKKIKQNNKQIIAAGVAGVFAPTADAALVVTAAVGCALLPLHR
jgi:hypothetical protein